MALKQYPYFTKPQSMLKEGEGEEEAETEWIGGQIVHVASDLT